MHSSANKIQSGRKSTVIKNPAAGATNITDTAVKKEKTAQSDSSYGSVPLYGHQAFLQAKLAVNTPGDQYEQEANTIADKIVQDSGNGLQQKEPGQAGQSLKYHPPAAAITPKLQAKGGAGQAASPQLESKLSSSAGKGNSLDANTNALMGGKFGADFSHIKIHTDNDAVNMNREINARAFTVGSDIYFNKGQYNPASPDGKHLLAHELTHTLQQGAGSSQQVIQRDTPAPATADSPDFKLPSVDLREGSSPLVASALGSGEINGFATGSAKIPSAGESTLRYQAQQIIYFLKKYPVSAVRIAGHTDKEGKEENNLTLGQERADAVKDFLLAEGVPPEVMSTESKGESSPAVITKDGVAEPKNRRVEIFFSVKSTALSFGTGQLSLSGTGSGIVKPALPKIELDITKLPGIGEGPRIPYRDPGEGDWWKKIQDINERIKRIPPRKEQSAQGFIIDKIMDAIKPITKKLPDIPLLGRPEDLIRKALEKGSEKLCEEVIDQLDTGSAEKDALKAACKAGAQQKF